MWHSGTFLFVYSTITALIKIPLIFQTNQQLFSSILFTIFPLITHPSNVRPYDKKNSRKIAKYLFWPIKSVIKWWNDTAANYQFLIQFRNELQEWEEGRKR